MKNKIFISLALAAQISFLLALSIGCGSRWKGSEYVATEPIPADVPEGTLAIAIKEERFATLEVKAKPLSLPGTEDFYDPEYEEYLIGPGDELVISIWVVDASTTKRYSVDLNGKIMVPFAGRVKVGGMDVLDARAAVTKSLKEYIKEPMVDMTVRKYYSKKLYIYGEGSPIEQPFIQLKKRTTLFELLNLFNSSRVEIDGVYLRRDKEIYPLNIRALLEGDFNYNVELKHKDILYIPSNTNAFVTIAGEIGSSKIIPFRQGMTLFDAVMQAGGFTIHSRVRDIRIIRGGLYNPTLITIDLKPFFRTKHPSLNDEEFLQLRMSYDSSRKSHKSLEKLLLQKNDFIYVPRTVIGNWNRFMELIQPTLASVLGYPVQIFSQIVLLDRTVGGK